MALGKPPEIDLSPFAPNGGEARAREHHPVLR
jgi:hypothetical protein